jgi:hypothetical protein
MINLICHNLLLIDAGPMRDHPVLNGTEAFRTSCNEIPVWSQFPFQFGYQFLLGISVKINHHIPTKNHIER